MRLFGGFLIAAVLISQGGLWFEMHRINERLDGMSAQLGEITTMLRNQPMPKAGG